MPILVGTCPRHGEFERLTARWEPHVACPTCGTSVTLEPTAPGVRFRGDGFQTPRPTPRAPDVGTAKLKQNRY
jgi:predicted nucleic acid-binding Zn ribbon protein